MKERYVSPEALSETALGSRVVCEDKSLMFEEAPDAYKEIEDVVDDLVTRGIIGIVAIMSPVVTYKTRGENVYNN